MKTRHIVVEQYSPAWATEFNKIKLELEQCLGDLTVGIEHVGSTAVKGMSAKPIIDIDVIIKDYSVFPEVLKKLSTIGYVHEGDLGIKEREAFKYQDKPHLQKHHLYVCPQNSKELQRQIAFRDFLRTNPEAVQQYSRVKEEAARLYPDSIEKYIEYKSPIIAEFYSILGLAEET